MIISLLLSNWVICDLREMNDLTFLLWIFIMPQESSRRDSSELFNTKIEPVILVSTINLPLMSNSIHVDCSKIEINICKGRTIPQTSILLRIDYHFASLAFDSRSFILCHWRVSTASFNVSRSIPHIMKLISRRKGDLIRQIIFQQEFQVICHVMTDAAAFLQYRGRVSFSTTSSTAYSSSLSSSFCYDLKYCFLLFILSLTYLASLCH
jgi:hypothetical protein